MKKFVTSKRYGNHGITEAESLLSTTRLRPSRGQFFLSISLKIINAYLRIVSANQDSSFEARPRVSGSQNHQIKELRSVEIMYPDYSIKIEQRC